MDISRQVFRRSSRMGMLYVVIGLLMGVLMTAGLDVAGRVGTVTQNGTSVDVGGLLGSILVPLGALVGLIAAVPVFYLFVYDKNAGVLEYLLAVGMNQREVFSSYLKAALQIALLVMAPELVLNLVLSPNGLLFGAESVVISLVTGLADVALVTVLMTGFSSMQRKPTGMNSPLGVAVGLIPVFPGLVLGAVLGSSFFYVEGLIAIAIFAIAAALLLSLDRLVSREKLLP
jgi:hypothetical protein